MEVKSHLWGPHLNALVNLFLVSSGDMIIMLIFKMWIID